MNDYETSHDVEFADTKVSEIHADELSDPHEWVTRWRERGE
jgi:hypothetical protein